LEDLKIVFYVLVAIVWVVYNNFKKIKDASQKRDYTKPPPEIIQENWPKTIEKKPAVKTVVIKEKPVQRSVDEPLKRPVLVRRNHLRQERQPLPVRQKIVRPAIAEGGNIKPSKLVQFQDEPEVELSENVLLQELKNTSFRQAFIWSEILKRPYN
jgi:hypothetical protein